MTDLVRELRAMAVLSPRTEQALFNAAADEIDRLNATIQRVRDVLGGPFRPWFHSDEILEALEGGEAS